MAIAQNLAPSPQSLAKIKAAFTAAETSGIQTVWQGKKPVTYKYSVVRDGDADKPDQDAYAGKLFINASSKLQPGIVDANVQPIIDRTELYAGCYGRVQINFFPYAQAGNKGIGCGLINVQKLSDGESLGGRMKAEDAFGDDAGVEAGPVEKAPWEV